MKIILKMLIMKYIKYINKYLIIIKHFILILNSKKIQLIII